MTATAAAGASPFERLAALSAEAQAEFLEAEAERRDVSLPVLKQQLVDDWSFIGRPKQQEPPGDWTYWLILAGRGFGKTRTGARWIRKVGLAETVRIGLVAPTLRDVRATMIEGESGILAEIPAAALRGQSREYAYNKSQLQVTLANGTIIEGFSSEVPDRLRGPQHHYVWGEEVSSWLDARHGDVLASTFSNMKLGLRLGLRPRAVLTTTPKANKLTRDLLKIAPEDLAVVRGSSFENRLNLAEAWWRAVVIPLLGTRTGRQEIEAEVLDDVEGALWTLALIDACRVPPATPEVWQNRMRRIVVAVDPNTTSGETADDAGIVVAGLGHSDRHGYILEDRTQTRGGPRRWATEAVNAYYDWKADRIVAEKNQGGEMVALTIHSVDPNVPVKLVNASRGKRTRAEPVAALYGSLEKPEENPTKVHHAGVFAELEDEMTTWDGGGESPNRMDACLVAGTVVCTRRGDVPIERVSVGDYVLTRRGWKPVIHAEMTAPSAPTVTVEMSDGRMLTGTSEHPVWVEGHGWRPMGALGCGDRCLTLRATRSCGSMAFRIRAAWTHHRRAALATSVRLAAAARRCSTERSGRPLTERFRTGCTSTTSTETRLTTMRRTSLSLLRRITPAFTLLSFAKLAERTLIASVLTLLLGTDLKKDWRGIETTDGEPGKDASQPRSSVVAAERPRDGISLDGAELGSVAVSAPVRSPMNQDGTRSRPSVLSAGSRFSRTSTARSPRRAPVSVARVYESVEQPVYNLEVKDAPEFFANGILVHNCVWALTELKLWRPGQQYASGLPESVAGDIPSTLDVGAQERYSGFG